ncbi:MAG: diphthamide synthesis protein [Nanoarchaeota archaeon]|nr:diphthamide synthesis protein [Nanoarchaeota archaeon]
MKKLFIPLKAKIKDLLKDVNLDGKVGIVTTVQYLDSLKSVKNFGGQVIGCNVSNALKLKMDKYLFVGEGRFHALQIALKTGKEVYILNPFDKQLSKIDKKEIEDMNKKIKVKQVKYLHAKNKGVLVCIKEGQFKLKEALKLNLPIFLFDTLDNRELENFKVDMWINTACNRIDNKNIINLEDLPK